MELNKIAVVEKDGGNTNSLKRQNYEYLFLTLVLLLGLYLRLVTVSTTQMSTPFLADAKQYTAYAYNLRLHGVYSKDAAAVVNTADSPTPDALRSPGYPLFLYLFTFQMDRFAVNVFYIQAILSTITIAIVYFLGRSLIGAIGAAIAAALTAISPHLILVNINILTETIFTLFLIAGITLLVKALASGRILELAFSGVLIGYATLVRPTLQYFIIFVIFFVLLGNHSKDKRTAVISILVPFTALVSIWFLRNLLVIGRLSDPTLAISALHHGMYPGFIFDGQPNSFGFPYRFDPASQEITSSMNSVIREIFNRFCSRPKEHILWFLSKPFYLFRWGLIQGRDIFVYPLYSSPYDSLPIFQSTYAFMRSIHPIAIGFSFFGATIAWLPRRLLSVTLRHALTARLLSLTYVYFILVHIVGAPFPRYSMPIRPITYILAILPIYIGVTVIHKNLMSRNGNVENKS